MKNLIKNTILVVVVMVVLGVFLVGCEKNNVEPENLYKTELVVTLGDLDSITFEYYVSLPNSDSVFYEVNNIVRRGESTKIVLPETLPKGTTIVVGTGNRLKLKEVSEIDVKVNSSKYEVHYEKPHIEVRGFESFIYYVAYVIILK